MGTQSHTGFCLKPLVTSYSAPPVPAYSHPQVMQPQSPSSLLRPPLWFLFEFQFRFARCLWNISICPSPCLDSFLSPMFPVSYGFIVLSTSRRETLPILLLLLSLPVPLLVPSHHQFVWCSPSFPLFSPPPHNAGLTPLLNDTGTHEFSYFHNKLEDPVSVKVW